MVGRRHNYTQPEYCAESFRNADKIFPTRTVPRAGPVLGLSETGRPQLDLDDFAARNAASGLIVLLGEEILYETYGGGADETSRFVSFSMAKPFVSTLVGLALSEGLIESVDEAVTRYLPELEGSGYDGVPIKAILQMSSGVEFRERYDEPDSDVMRMLFSIGREPRVPLRTFAQQTRRHREPGEKFHYCSGDSVVLTWLVSEVVETTLSEYMAERLWKRLGAEHDAYWVLDGEEPDGSEAGFTGFGATLRDYARFGLLMSRRGVLGGEPILPPGWVEEATVPDRPHVVHGQLHPSARMGFQYQWWSIPGEDRAFSSEGGWGQFMMVNPRLELVLVKTGFWPQPWVRESERETYALFEDLERDALGSLHGFRAYGNLGR